MFETPSYLHGVVDKLVKSPHFQCGYFAGSMPVYAFAFRQNKVLECGTVNNYSDNEERFPTGCDACHIGM